MPVDYKDYYAVLGVARDATPEQIKQAFRTLARKYHPDVARDKKTAEEKFKEINEANEVLGDPEKRRRYDELGSQWQNGQEFQPPPRRQGRREDEPEFHFRGTGFSDFFEHFFAGGWRTSSPPQPSSADRQAGADIEGDILVSLDEVLHGTIRPISLQLVDPRTGEVQVDTLQVRIPPGATQGRRIRVPGRGEPGVGGAPAGDLYLRVRHAAHPDFEAHGFDLHRSVELAPWDAVLGAAVTIRTLDGTIKLRVPPGTTSGRVLRVKGHGLPKEKGGERGDLYARIEIAIQPVSTDGEREAWERLRKLATSKERKGAL